MRDVKRMTLILSLGILLLSLFPAFAAEVKVDWSDAVGPVKPVNGVGQPPMIGQLNDWSMFHYLKEAGIPYSRLHDVGGWLGGGLYVDIPNLFPEFDADEDDPKNYRFAFTDSLMTALDRNGVEPFFRLGVTIENFVYYPGNFPAQRTQPPKDFAKWARICEHVIRHYTEGWADGYRLKVTHWEIWNEPENNPDDRLNPMFQAPFSEYMRLYGTVAPYLKAKFPHLKIGGYGHCGFYAAVGSDHVPAANSSPRMMYFVDCAHAFLKAAKEKGWPLDFFSYHSYSDPVEALRQVRFAREILDRYGFTGTEACFNEWLPRPAKELTGTPHQAAMIAAELIGLQNGPCDSAMIYDARCGVGNYSPLFNPMTQGPHKAYFAFRAFNELRKLGTAVRAVSSDTNLWVTAARKGNRGVVMLANYSEREIQLDLKAEGLKAVSWSVTSPERWDAYAPGVPKAVPSDSFVLLFFNDERPTWEKPKTTRRYLQGPLSSRLAVLFREGKLLVGECVHEHDWKKVPYGDVWAYGLWLMHGERATPFDFRKAKLAVDPDAVPIAAETWREGDLELEMEACAPFGRKPNAHLRVRATNRGTAELKDVLSFVVRRGHEKRLVPGAPDGYVPYRPDAESWMSVPSWWEPEKEKGVVREGPAFVAFAEDIPAIWDAKTSSMRLAVALRPGETRVIDCVVGAGTAERPHYDEVRAGVRRDWLRELARVDGRSPLVRNLTVQMLQCFSRPAKGDYILPRQGGLQRWVWPGDQRAVSAALDRLGYRDYVEKTVEFYFGQYLQPNGEVGPFGNGWASDTASCLTVFARHALATGDAAFWTRWRDAAVKAFGWIRDTREKDGLFPPLKSADSESVFRNWGGTDCTNLEALELFAAAAKRQDDPISAEAERVAADYRAAIGRALERWRTAAVGTDEFPVPFAPDGANEEHLGKTFYYAHPGAFAKNGFFTADELVRVRRWMMRTGVANDGKGLYMISRDGVPGRGAEGNFWYLTWAEHHWFKAWMRVGRKDLAKQALDACLRYAVTDEYMVGERYHAANPWLFPWSPNASGSGRIIQMLLDSGMDLDNEKGE